MRLGPYEILSALGSGGMGVVYQANDPKLQRTVAIKVLSEPDAFDAGRLLEEARAASAVSHPNICTIYDVGDDNGQTFIVMEYVEGRPLAQVIPSDGLPPETIVRYAVQIADALACAHNHGVLHGDLKSQNVIITPDGRAKVVDFGVASRLPSFKGDAHTRTQRLGVAAPGTVAGTLGCMAPELLRGGSASTQTDIWALGIVIYEMAAGRLPFVSASSADLIAAILKDPPLPLPEQIPSGLRRVIERALAKESGHRFTYAAELRAALEVIQPSAHHVAHAAADGERATPSVAVLPFSNLSSDPEQEYFCDGMAEEIINVLARAKGLRVVARTSAFAFKRQHVDVRRIGALLGVEHVVEGSVRKSGDRLRIGVQLIGVADGFPVWSERFERELAEVFAIQDEIALAIVERLQVELLGGEREAMVKRSTARIDLYTLLLLARYHWNLFTADGTQKCQASLEKALSLDPACADAHAAMAMFFLQLGPGGLGQLPARIVAPKARAAADRALSLDPLNGDAHRALALSSIFYDRDWPGAGRHCRIACELEPNVPMSHQVYAFYLTAAAQHEHAVREVERAVQLDPIAPLVLENAAWVHYHARHFEKAREYCRRCLDLNPHFGWAYLIEGMLDCQRREFDAGIVAFEKANIRGISEGYLGFACGAAGKAERARSILHDLQGRHDRDGTSAYYLALIHAGLGERDQAVRWLAAAAEERPGETIFTAWLASDSMWDEFRPDSVDEVP